MACGGVGVVVVERPNDEEGLKRSRQPHLPILFTHTNEDSTLSPVGPPFSLESATCPNLLYQYIDVLYTTV